MRATFIFLLAAIVFSAHPNFCLTQDTVREKAIAWIKSLGSEDPAERIKAANAIKNISHKDFHLVIDAARVTDVAESAMEDSRQVVRDAAFEMKMARKSVDYSRASTGLLVSVLQQAIRKEANELGRLRSFYYRKREFPWRWFNQHQQLITVIEQLKQRNAKIATPMLRDYFSELSNLKTTTTINYQEKPTAITLGEHFAKGEVAKIEYRERGYPQYSSRVHLGSSSGENAAIAMLLMDALNQAVQKLGDPTIAEIQKGLLDEEPVVVAQSLRCVSQNKSIPRGYAKQLRKFLQYENEQVQFEAALALLSFDSSAIPDTVEPIRAGMNQFGERRTAIQLVEVLLREQQSDTRLLAIELLGELGPHAKSAIRPLTAVLNDDEIPLRLAAFQALEKIDP